MHNVHLNLAVGSLASRRSGVLRQRQPSAQNRNRGQGQGLAHQTLQKWAIHGCFSSTGHPAPVGCTRLVKLVPTVWSIRRAKTEAVMGRNPKAVKKFRVRIRYFAFSAGA
jgi:hypothetical protein